MEIMGKHSNIIFCNHWRNDDIPFQNEQEVGLLRGGVINGSDSTFLYKSEKNHLLLYEVFLFGDRIRDFLIPRVCIIGKLGDAEPRYREKRIMAFVV